MAALNDNAILAAHRELEKSLGTLHRQARLTSHPLLGRLDHREAPPGARRIELPANVGVQAAPVTASYELPALTATMTIPAHAMTTQEIIAKVRSFGRTLRSDYYRTVMSDIYSKNTSRIGFSSLLPESRGTNTIGRISEAAHPGWQHAVRKGKHPNQTADLLWDLQIECMDSDGSPDIIVLGKNRWFDLYSWMQPQQVFYVLEADRRLIAFGGGFVFADPACQPEDAFSVATRDFGYYSTPASVSFSRRPDDSALVVSVRTGYQIVTGRRNRSGRLTIEPTSENL